MKTFVNIVSYFFILLFVYAAVSKILDFENFQVQIAQSPLLSAYAGFVSYAVIIIEILITTLLSFEKSRTIGLYAATALMTSFTAYIFLILNYSDFVPCSCGGILEKLGWTEHLIFNSICVIAGIVAVYFTRSFSHKSYRFVTIVLSATNLFSSALVVTLFLTSEHIMKRENNFIRRFVPYPITSPKIIDLKADTYYFAGNNGDTIFLGNYEAPLLMATILPKYDKIDFDTLKISHYNLNFKSLELNVRYPEFILADGNVPAIFEGKLPNLFAKKAMIENLYFSKIKIISPNQYIFKTTLTQNLTGTIGAINTKDNTLKFYNNILEKQKDGLFDTDGTLQVDYSTNQFIYTYYYRNQYIVTDFNFRNIKRFKTIDTVKTAHIKIKRLSKGVQKMDAPPLEVNFTQAVHKNILFNISKQRGQYESKSRWREAKIVDVYNYKNNTYKYSFYIYNRKNKSVRSMRLTKKHLYVLIGNQLIKFSRRL